MTVPRYFIDYSSSSSFNNKKPSTSSLSLSCKDGKCLMEKKHNGKTTKKNISFDDFVGNIQNHLLNMGIVKHPSEISPDIIRTGHQLAQNNFLTNQPFFSDVSTIDSDLSDAQMTKPELLDFSDILSLQKDERDKPEKTSKQEKDEKPDKKEKTGKRVKQDKQDKHEKQEKQEKQEKPEKTSKRDKQEKNGKQDKPKKQEKKEKSEKKHGKKVTKKDKK